jgi:hypothetical protein
MDCRNAREVRAQEVRAQTDPVPIGAADGEAEPDEREVRGWLT